MRSSTGLKEHLHLFHIIVESYTHPQKETKLATQVEQLVSDFSMKFKREKEKSIGS